VVVSVFFFVGEVLPCFCCRCFRQSGFAGQDSDHHRHN